MEINKDGTVKFLTNEELRSNELEKLELEKSYKKKKKLYSNFFNNEIGIKFLKEMCSRSGFLKSSLLLSQSNNTTDPYKIAFLDGMRELFIETMSLLEDDLLTKTIQK